MRCYTFKSIIDGFITNEHSILLTNRFKTSSAKVLFVAIILCLGFYCMNGTETARQYPCPVGTYSNTTQLESEDECRLCPEGKIYCVIICYHISID